MDPITLRAIERLLAVAIGGLSIFLGYYLFLRIPHRSEAEGKFSFPNGISVHLARVGPGVFFALFGAAVVGLSIFRPISYETLARSQVAGPPEASLVGRSTEAETRTSFTGMVQTVTQNRTLDRLELRDDLTFLNRLPRSRRPDLDEGLRRALELRPAQIKLRLMLQDWSPDWGDREAFRAWVDRGAGEPVPAGLEAAAALFHSGREERS